MGASGLITVDGTRYINNFLTPNNGLENKDPKKPNLSIYYFVRCYDGKQDILYEPFGNQVTLFSGETALRAYNVQTLRQSPDPSNELGQAILSEVKAKGKLWEYTKAQDGGSVVITFDMGTGLMRSFTKTAPKGESGSYKVQGRVKMYDGIPFPTLSGWVTFINGRAHSFDLFEVKEASFNNEFPPAAFKVAVPAGTTLGDNRQGKDPAGRKLKKDTADILLFADSFPTGGGSYEVRPSFGVGIGGGAGRCGSIWPLAQK